MKIETKDDLLKKLRMYKEVPDDDNTRYKQIIYKAFLECPELLYAIHETSLESELFNDDGTINYDGEWDMYFSDSSRDGNIRPYLFIPQTQTEVHNYVCYQSHFDEMPRYNSIEKYGLITFTIMIHGADRMDKSTGLPRHDLLGAIIKDKINWTNLFGTQCHVISDKESMTDNDYVVRTIVFRITALNSIVQSTFNNEANKVSTNVINKLGRM